MISIASRGYESRSTRIDIGPFRASNPSLIDAVPSFFLLFNATTFSGSDGECSRLDNTTKQAVLPGYHLSTVCF